MLQKPYDGDYKFTLEFGESYGGILGLGNALHKGLDVALPCGTPVLSPGDGTVHKVNFCDGCSDYGKYVELEIGKLWVRLGHMSRVDVLVDNKVTTGQPLGCSGNTGKSTNCHLHIGVQDMEKYNEAMHDYQNPRDYIAFDSGPAPSQPVPDEPDATPEPDGVRKYVVKSGDSLWRIAKYFYGQGSKWPLIYEANKEQIDNPNLIFPDQELIIP